MSTPAEQRAAREGLDIVAVTAFELVRVAANHPMIVRTVDGREVLLRLPTVEELIRFNREALATMPDTAVGPPPITAEQAARLAAPLRLPSD